MVKLREPELEEVLAFCAQDPVERVFLEDVARRGIGRFTAVADNGRLTALCHSGSNLVPSGENCAAFADLAVNSTARMIIGEEKAVSALWSAAADGMPVPREDRPGQPVYVIEEPPDPGESGLRPAVEDDFELLVGACAAAHEHELGIDPLERDPDGFRWRTRNQINEGRRSGRIPTRAVTATPSAGCATCAVCSSTSCRRSACSSAARTSRRSGSTTGSECGERSRIAA